ncbi:MAG: hypothetical protein NTZ69_19115 [Bacteroidia bacterium]|nr:hypothetical protein [Bacteroidia bacterium]
MKNIYYLLSRIITPNVISILIGIFSGLVINLLTNQDSSYYHCSIGFITIIIVFLIFLLFLFENFNEQYHLKKMNDKSKSDGDLWRLAILDRTYWKYLFFIYFTVIIASTIFTIHSIKMASISVSISNQNKEQKQSNSFTTVTASINQLKIEILQQKSEILQLNDSIAKLMHKRPNIKPGKVK